MQVVLNLELRISELSSHLSGNRSQQAGDRAERDRSERNVGQPQRTNIGAEESGFMSNVIGEGR